MSSPNLAVAHVAASQNQKEVTINAALDALDNATQRTLAVDLSSASATLTNDQFRRNVRFACTGADTAGRTVTVPQFARFFVVTVASSTAAVSVVRGSTSLPVSPGEAAIFSTDGTANGLARIGRAAGEVRLVTESGASRTLSLGDAGAYIRCTGATTVTVTVPPNTDVPFPIGSTVVIEQAGAGEVAIAEGSGVTINFPSTAIAETAGQFAVVQAVKIAADEWTLFGNLAAAP